MNQTEAWEIVWNAAVERLSHLTLKRPKQAAKCARLERALSKCAPRVQRMRARLDFSRAKRAGKQSRPSWATP